MSVKPTLIRYWKILIFLPTWGAASTQLASKAICKSTNEELLSIRFHYGVSLPLGCMLVTRPSGDFSGLAGRARGTDDWSFVVVPLVVTPLSLPLTIWLTLVFPFALVVSVLAKFQLVCSSSSSSSSTVALRD
jgi:hypothetical protein